MYGHRTRRFSEPMYLITNRQISGEQLVIIRWRRIRLGDRVELQRSGESDRGGYLSAIRLPFCIDLASLTLIVKVVTVPVLLRYSPTTISVPKVISLRLAAVKVSVMLVLAFDFSVLPGVRKR